MRHIYWLCRMFGVAVVLVAASAWAAAEVSLAQTAGVVRTPSNCLAIAQNLPRARFVSLKQVQGDPASGDGAYQLCQPFNILD